MFNYSKQKETDPIVYNANLTKIRINLRAYVRGLKLPKDAIEPLLDQCIDLVRHWLNTGEIKTQIDEDLAMARCRTLIKSRICELGFDKSDIEKSSQSICWKCKRAVPKIIDERYVRGCEWSVKQRPVPGWNATERTLEGKKTYKVHECPKFVKSRS